MRETFLAVVLLAGVGLAGVSQGQSGGATSAPVAVPGAAAPISARAAPIAKPGPNDAVITLNDFCAPGQMHKSATACQTVITRAELESLTAALQPDMAPELRGKVAIAYARMLRMAAAAEKRGLDKTPAFEQEMRYARLQLLSQDLSRALRQEADQVSAADIEDYYQKNSAAYEQATLARIFVPAGKKAGAQLSGGDAVANGTQHPSDDTMAKVAADLRLRAVNGEDPDVLQAEAYTAAGIPGTSPKTTLKDLRRASVPPSHELAFDLPAGTVSEVISDQSGGHFIYKMLHREPLTLEEATPEIQKLLADGRYKQALKGFSDGTVFNDAYFASEATPAPRRHHKQAEGSGQPPPGP
jgi:hypothetical protein